MPVKGDAQASGTELLLVAVAAALASGLLLLLPSQMSPDGWYALLGGREIVAHGLPSRDTLTVWGQGRRWVDQQWLAQISYYALYSLGGLRAALLANTSVVVATFAATVAISRRRGGSITAVLVVCVPAAIAIGVSASPLRPQTLALPLYVALVWLLVADARRPSRRVFLVAPLLVLWANLHGSVVLGSLLVSVHALVAAWERRRITVRDVALLACAIVGPFVSPYGLGLGGYYHALLFNSELARYVPDWMPTAPSLGTLPFYVLALTAVYLLGRARTSVTLLERVLLIVLLALGIEAARGVVWFVLFALATLPTMLTAVHPREIRVAKGAALAVLGASAIVVVAGLVLALTKRSSWVDGDYPPAVARTSSAAAGRTGKVFSNGAYSDWLLLTQPSLRGRVAYDARFEVLPHGRLADAAAVSIGRSDWRRILAPFVVVVLRPEETELRDALVRDGGWTRIPTDRHVVVFRRDGV